MSFKTKFAVGDVVVVVQSGVQGTVTEVDTEREIYTVKCPGFTSSYTRVMLKMAPAQEPTKTRIRVSQIKKGDRFWNEFWGKEVIATSDAYRLDGTIDERYSDTKPKPKEAVMHYDVRSGEWRHSWWMIQVGVTTVGVPGATTISGGGWSKPEYEYIEVVREEEAA